MVNSDFCHQFMSDLRLEKHLRYFHVSEMLSIMRRHVENKNYKYGLPTFGVMVL